MPRAQFRDAVFIRQPGDLLRTPPTGLAALYNVGTLTPIGETIYADDSSGTTLPNPIPIAEDGVLEFWLAEERELDIVTNCPGFLENRSTVTTDAAGPASQGAVGPPGANGATGPAGPPGTPITWRGTWSASTPYVVNDSVSAAGSSYVCVAPVTGGSGPATDTSHWTLMAAAGVSNVPGPVGPQGATGPVGPQGVQGDQGIQGPPGGAPAWQGAWSASVDYASNDAVSLNGSSYYAAGNPAIGVMPPTAPWQQIAAKGDTGPQGPQGTQGPIGNTGATGPQGAVGPTGPQGATGATGSQGPIGNTGPQGAQGPQGTTGATGATGPGVAAGGTTGQVLGKNSATNYDTIWLTPFSKANADALYLPLSGGTLTGNLNGTTATFSGVLYAGDIYAARGASNGAVFLGSDGTHYLYWDSARYQLASGSLQVDGNLTLNVTGAQINFVDTAHAIVNSGGNMIYLCGTGTAHLFYGASGTYGPVNTGTLSVTGTIGASDNIVMPRGKSLCWGDANTSILGSGSNNDIYLNTWVNLTIHSQGHGADLAVFAYPGNLTLAASVLYFNNSGSYFISMDRTNFNFGGGGLSAPNGGCAIGGNYTAQGVGSSGYAFQTANAAAAYGQGYANAWVNASSLDFKEDVRQIEDPLSIVLHDELHGVRYTHKGFKHATDSSKDHGPTPSLGFVADYWAPHVPEVVSFDENGKPVGMDYARVGAITFQALKQLALQVEKLTARIAELEAA